METRNCKDQGTREPRSQQYTRDVGSEGKTKRRKTEERGKSSASFASAAPAQGVCKQAGVCDAILRRPGSWCNEVGGGTKTSPVHS